MKVTAIIPDHLIDEVKDISGGKNITESLIIALNAYLKQKKLEATMYEIEDNPLFVAAEPDVAYNIRKGNRNR